MHVLQLPMADQTSRYPYSAPTLCWLGAPGWDFTVAEGAALARARFITMAQTAQSCFTTTCHTRAACLGLSVRQMCWGACLACIRHSYGLR